MNSASAVFDIYELQFFLNDLSGYNAVVFREKWQKLMYIIPYIILNAVLLINNLMCFYLTYSTRDDPKELLYVMTMAITTCVCSVNIFISDVYKNEIQKLHNDLSCNLRTPKVEKSPRLLEVKTRMDQKFTLICKAFYVLTTGAMLLFVGLPVLLPGEKSVPYVFPLKNLPSPYYEGIYVFQALILSLFMLNTISFDMICNGFMLRVCCCLEIIASRLEECRKFCPNVDYSEYVQDYYDPDIVFKSNSENSLLANKKGQNFRNATKEMVEFLKSHIRLHQEIMGQLEIIDKIYNLVVVLRLLIGTLVFAIAASVVFSDNFNFLKDIRLGGFAVGGFIDLFLFCYCGSHIIESEEKVELALYSLPWYEMDIKTRKTVLFALMGSRKSKGITAGKIFSLDLELFLQILKFAHSFITLFKNF